MMTYTITPAMNGYVLSVYGDRMRTPETFVFRKLSGLFTKVKQLETQNAEPEPELEAGSTNILEPADSVMMPARVWRASELGNGRVTNSNW